ncbi:MAG: response regulator transcription factor [Lachnospiraceae bacterium]|nr:response regulator transcription factor [Lachnospiraceae bacterium]MBR6664637.1 response regulator transcription factor [Lachnospiraceae bacterium]
MAHILIVEDEEAINRLIKQNLRLAGHECTQVFDGLEAKKVLEELGTFDLIIMDVMLPHIDGFTLMQYVKGIPVIFLTAKSQLEDKITGLTSGAWDYLTKPFEMLELIARINLVLQKTQKESKGIWLNDVYVNLEARTVSRGEEEIELAKQEFDLLEILIRNRNIALSREKLLDLAWGYDYMGDTRTVDVHITKLRKKLNLEQYIKTVYKTGYRLEI